MDVLITKKGREQAAQGVLNFAYASFTDLHTFYQASGSDNIAEDHTDRVYFEAFSRHQDTIIPELELGTTIKSFKTDDFILDGVTLASGSFSIGAVEYVNILSASDARSSFDRSQQKTDAGPTATPRYSKLPKRFFKSLLKCFTDQRIIGTTDNFSSTSGFRFHAHTGSFDDYIEHLNINGRRVRSKTEFNEGARRKSFDSIKNLFQDSKVGQMPNYRYLAPINTDGSSLGRYPNISQPARSIDDLMSHLQDRHRQTFHIAESSMLNNMIGQVFEYKHLERNGKIELHKLSIIDYGEHTITEDDVTKEVRVFFIGKLIDFDDYVTGGGYSLQGRESLNFMPDKAYGKSWSTQPGGGFENSYSNDFNRKQSFVNIFTVILS